MRKLNGFTLIELIVVIAIIGVLASILVPSLIGYLKDSKYSTANSNAKQVYTNSTVYCTKCMTENNVIVNGKFAIMDLCSIRTDADLEYNGTFNDFEIALCLLMGGKAKSGIASVNVEDGGLVESRWTSSYDMDYIGSYPTPSTLEEPVESMNF